MMKITIDTQQDSHEDIRKVLHILASITQEKNTSLPQQSEEDTAGFMNMFGDEQKEVQDTAPDFSSFLNLTNKNEEEDKKDPKVQLF